MEKSTGREGFFIRMEAYWKENSEMTVPGIQRFPTNKTDISF
jgi:hypothetical protein